MTPFPELDGVLRELLRELRATLGDELVAVSLQGSFALGAADEHSDVDFVVAVRRPLDDARVVALQAMHGRVFELQSRWAQHLEGSYFPVDVLRSCERRGEPLWYLDNGHRSLERSAHCNTAVVRQTVREHGLRLLGPAPDTLVDPVPVRCLREEMLATACEWGGEFLRDPGPFRNRFYQGFVVLSYCRFWRDLVTGTVGSKRQGAEWARARLDAPFPDLIDRAWATRPVPEVSIRRPPDPSDFERTLRLVDLVVERCRRFARDSGLIVPAGPEDVEALAAIELENMRPHFSPHRDLPATEASIREILDRTWVLADGGPVGFYSWAPDDVCAVLLSIQVAAHRRGRGLGSRLLRHFEERAKANGFAKAGLAVHAGNPARAWYERHGYAFFAEDGPDCHAMLKSIRPAEGTAGQSIS